MRNKIDILSIYSELTTLNKIEALDVEEFYNVKEERILFLMSIIENKKCKSKDVMNLYSELIELHNIYNMYSKSHKDIILNRIYKVTKRLSKLTKKGIV